MKMMDSPRTQRRRVEEGLNSLKGGPPEQPQSIDLSSEETHNNRKVFMGDIINPRND